MTIQETEAIGLVLIKGGEELPYRAEPSEGSLVEGWIFIHWIFMSQLSMPSYQLTRHVHACTTL